MRYLISGGGTGGHIFPAVSIANALREMDPEAEILFVGALGRMEMEKVPQAGYQIVGLPIQGFNRAKPWKNIAVTINLIRSLHRARRIISDFRPDVGVGVGGYASGAAMKMAARMGVPILLQEQNGFAGVTNKLLRNDAQKICVAYENMDRFFPADKIILTGNPVRQNLTEGTREEALEYFHLDPNRKTLLIIGGSLGARTINQAVAGHLDELRRADIQVIWQTGKFYYEKCHRELEDYTQHHPCRSIQCSAFVARMDLAYAAADLVISRAGASSISELCLLGKPSILVPSPNVAEDHQTHNAMALVRRDAAVLVRDTDAAHQLVNTAIDLIHDTPRLAVLTQNVRRLAQKDSAQRIAIEVMKLAKQNNL